MNIKLCSSLRRDCLVVLLVVVALTGAHAEDRSLMSNGVNLRYIVEGQGPPVVLIHGLTVDSDWQWAEPGIIKALAKNYRIIAMDCRGHGKSDKPHEPAVYGIEMVEDVRRLLDHMKIKKAHIVGYSLGGAIALKFLVTHPGRCSSVILGETAVYHEHYDFSAEDKAARNSALVSSPEQVMPKPPPGAPADVVRRREAWIGIRHAFKAYAAVFQSLSALRVTDAELRSNQVPTLGLFCAANSQEEYLTKHLANFKSAFIGGTHQDAFHRPEFINDLTAFLSAETAKKIGTP
jgi:pimeloyl-ACP methyl ester carboxylesterase